MANILEVSINEMEELEDLEELDGHTILSDLLIDWVNEQNKKIKVIQNQINQINELPAYKLDSLCEYLEDIDYHTSGLNIILSMVIGTPDTTEFGNELSGTVNTNIDIMKEEIECISNDNDNLLPKKWSLLYALWFHMIMKTDPESIYYSPRLGRDAWPYEFVPIS